MFIHIDLMPRNRARVVGVSPPGPADVPPPTPDVVPLPTPPAPPGPHGPSEIIDPPLPGRNEPVREPFLPQDPVRTWH